MTEEISRMERNSKTSDAICFIVSCVIVIVGYNFKALYPRIPISPYILPVWMGLAYYSVSLIGKGLTRWVRAYRKSRAVTRIEQTKEGEQRILRDFVRAGYRPSYARCSDDLRSLMDAGLVKKLSMRESNSVIYCKLPDAVKEALAENSHLIRPAETKLRKPKKTRRQHSWFDSGESIW